MRVYEVTDEQIDGELVEADDKKEIELIHQFELEQLSCPALVNLIGRLIKRGWVWRMPLAYQALAHSYIDYGFCTPKEQPVERPKIKIIVNDGHIKQIVAEKGEFDVVLEEEGGAVSTFRTSPTNRPMGETE